MTIDTETVELRAAWDAADEDWENEVAYFGSHREELWVNYPDQHVAVHNGELVAADADLVRLLDELRSKGIDPSQAWVRFVPALERRYLR